MSALFYKNTKISVWQNISAMGYIGILRLNNRPHPYITQIGPLPYVSLYSETYLKNSRDLKRKKLAENQKEQVSDIESDQHSPLPTFYLTTFARKDE